MLSRVSLDSLLRIWVNREKCFADTLIQTFKHWTFHCKTSTANNKRVRMVSFQHFFTSIYAKLPFWSNIWVSLNWICTSFWGETILFIHSKYFWIMWLDSNIKNEQKILDFFIMNQIDWSQGHSNLFFFFLQLLHIHINCNVKLAVIYSVVWINLLTSLSIKFDNCQFIE